MLWRKFTNAIVEKTLRFQKGAQIQAVQSDGTTSTIDLAELAAIDSIGAADLAKIDGITDGENPCAYAGSRPTVFTSMRTRAYTRELYRR